MSAISITAQEFDPSIVELGKSFLIIGTDAYLIDQVCDAVRIVLKDKFGADIIILYADEIKIAELNDHLDSFSIFSTAKLLFIKNADNLNVNTKKKELQALADYFSAPSENQSMLIVAEKVDLRTSAWKKIKEGCIHILCDPPKYGTAIRPWLEKQLRAHGKSMDSRAIETFCSRIELDYANANNELTKLILLNLDSKLIKEADVLISIGSSRVGTLIDFYRAMGTRNPKNCLELLERMLNSEWEALQVSYHLNKFYNIIWRILLLKQNHITPAEILKTHLAELYPRQRQEFINFSKNYNLADIENALSLLLDTDSKIKLSAAQPAVLLEMCLLGILAAK
ncbi:MAG: DNA polymerase III subunit delta [Candidatus Cloacimonadaceae bacterium]|nr:DNA polymerase III subunit delta [Candidatus Cloacimonadaceae bacterium]